ncbi:MAG: 16S rRNA (guanine(966)-N(2))-methyltransferase RsmD [candidate division WOR-3 bacterium]|nr:MAG: 16S rRNA (guanine(966)-N(2))-methyltransferase RsmD [candidate division WOR-3 bacterium]
MRIVGGACKKRSLKVPKKGIRPTKGIVRSAIFNILGEQHMNAEVLDVFAGSGALGIEAISRGARHCIFVEKKPRHLRMNLSKLISKSQARIVAEDFRRALRRLKNQEFDVIFADPPYNKNYVQLTLNEIVRYDLLAREGVVVIEHSPSEEFTIPDTLEKIKQRKYGDTAISFFKHRRH